jgi:hypothetical protein
VNGHHPFAYLRDVLERLPTQPASRIDELLPHRWKIEAVARARPSTKNTETLIDEGGSISITDLESIGCVVAASDSNNCLAMLVRRDGERLRDLMARFDAAIGLAWSHGLLTDEVNDRDR